MATDASKDDRHKLIQRRALTSTERRRLQEMFDKGEKSKQRDKDYAAEMFGQCVIGDPGSLIYWMSFIENLQRKYNNNKKGGNSLFGMKGMGDRAKLKKALNKQQLDLGVRAGVELLKLNPWDVPVLMQLADCLAGMGCYDPEQYLMKQAWEVIPDKGDVEFNRRCAEGLARVGRFDQATACWERVKRMHPDNDEAQQAIASLHTQKIEWAGSGKDEAKAAAAKGSADLKGSTREDELRQRHGENPADVGCATELTELLNREERYSEAEQVLKRTLDATGGDVKVREFMESVQILGARHQVMIAHRRAAEDPSDENKQLFQRMNQEQLKIELEIFRARCDRQPANTSWKYEFAIRLKRSGKITDAIKMFQEARGDAKRKTQVCIELGECFALIKQYKLALQNYELSLEGINEAQFDERKKALYRAGLLAMDHLGDTTKAERYLTELAGLDFTYKDVSERLDKINKERDKG